MPGGHIIKYLLKTYSRELIIGMEMQPYINVDLAHDYNLSLVT